jgi:hypothetical protein
MESSRDELWRILQRGPWTDADERHHRRASMLAPSLEAMQALVLERLARLGRYPIRPPPEPVRRVKLRATDAEIEAKIAALREQAGGRHLDSDDLHVKIQKLLPHRHVRRRDVRGLNDHVRPGRPRGQKAPKS